MFDSGITANSFISTIRAEIDIASVITDNSFVNWLNTVEQTCYTELIKELKKATLISSLTSPIAMTAITPAASEEQAIFEDIYKAYADSVELTKSTMVGGYVFSNLNTYWKDGNALGYELASGTPTAIDIFYYVRPKRKTVAGSGISSENVALPAEWLEVAASRLRGEAYKLANDDTQAAKWLNDYNLYIEQFKVWLANKNKVYGE